MNAPGPGTTRRAVVVALLSALPLGLAPAQAADSEPAHDAAPSTPSAWSTEVRAGYGNNSTLQLHLGEVAGVDLAFAALGASRRVAGGEALELRFAAEALPLLAISALRWDDVLTDCPSGRQCRLPSGFRSSGTIVGVGASPLGLETRVRLTSTTRLYAGARGGAVWFSSEIPLEGGGRLHYFGGVGTGLRIDVAGGAALRLGYEAHHLSNANTATQNPGLDWHLWIVGLSWRDPR